MENVKWISKKSLQERLNLKNTQFIVVAKKHKLRFTQIGRNKYFLREDVERMFDENLTSYE